MPPELEIQVRPFAHPQVVALIAALQQEYVLRYGGPDDTPIEADEFDPPAGVFLVATADADVVGGSAWRRIDAETVELKRLYVVPAARGRGYARRLIAATEAHARASGYRRLILVTGEAQPEAVALYQSAGYTAAPAFGHYAGSPQARFFSTEL